MRVSPARWWPALLAALPFLLLPPALLASEGGAVSGTISVSKTKVKTGGDKGEGDVVVWLEPLSATPPAPRPVKAQMDQKRLVFIPHVLAVPVGSTVTFLNNDNELHNVYFLNQRTGKELDIGTYGPGIPVDHVFSDPGPVVTLCKLHLEMAAYVVVLDSPWFAMAKIDETAQSAPFTIKDVPPGRYRLEVWHKKLKRKGGVVEVTVEAGKTVKADLTITKAKYAE